MGDLRCDKTFRAGNMRARVRCDLCAGHRSKFCEHAFPTWVARVTPKKGGGVHFAFAAKPGHSLPGYISK